MVSPLNSLVANLGPQRSGLENLGGQIQDLRAGEQRIKLQDQALQAGENQAVQSAQEQQRVEGMRKAKFVNSLGKRLLSVDESEWPALIQPHMTALTSIGYDPSVLANMTREQVEAAVAQTGAAIDEVNILSADQRGFLDLIKDFDPEDQEKARRIRARLDPAAGLTAQDIGDREREKLRAQADLKPDIEEDVAAGRERGKGISARQTTSIESGIEAAKGIPQLKRALTLIDSVKTGGFSAAAFKAKQALGVEAADEGELSALLGEAILGDLRATFGPAFTEKEGDKLERIRAGFGKNAKTNRRLIQRTLDIAQREAQRAIDDAIDAGDMRSANQIQDMLEDLEEAGQAVEEGDQPVTGNANQPTVTSQAEYDALPSGAIFIEDGKEYRKP